MNITHKSTKDEILSNSLELIDSLEKELTTRKSEQKFLVGLLVVVTIIGVIN